MSAAQDEYSLAGPDEFGPDHELLDPRPLVALIVLVGGLLAIVAALFLAVSYGAADISLGTVWRAVFAYDASNTDQLIIHEVRLPRVVTAGMVGACFAMAGTIMQGMTRNPLAAPDLMGLNAGAYLVIVLLMVFAPGLPFNWYILGSFLGAALGAGIVYGIGALSRGGLTPVKLALSGVAVSMLFGAISSGLELYYRLSDNLLYFFSGGVAGVTWEQVQLLWPFLALGFVGAMLLSTNITLLSLGDEVAQGLGQRTVAVKAAGTLVVVLLAGAAVWIGGAIGFVGLIVPHVTRFLVGLDYRWLIPCSAVLGALTLILADFAARMVNPPFEFPVGVITALIGVPFFLYLARRDRRGM